MKFYNLTPEHFDNDGLFKLSASFYLSLAFLCRAVVVWIAAVTQRESTENLLSIFYPRQQDFLFGLIPAGICLLVLIPMFFRRPTNSKKWHLIWKHGRKFLLLAVLVDLAFTISQAFAWHFRFSWPLAGVLFGQALILWYVAFSPWLPVYFSEWPEHKLLEDEAKS